MCVGTKANGRVYCGAMTRWILVINFFVQQNGAQTLIKLFGMPVRSLRLTLFGNIDHGQNLIVCERRIATNCTTCITDRSQLVPSLTRKRERFGYGQISLMTREEEPGRVGSSLRK